MKFSISEKFRWWLFKMRYSAHLNIKGRVLLKGNMPTIKLPGNSKIKLANNVVLNSDFKNSNTALAYRCALLCGYEGVITIGENSQLNGVSVTAYEKVTIGRNCQIASATFIADTDFHPVNAEIRDLQVSGYEIDHKHVAKKEIMIGDNVWIGWGAIILKGVTIGDNAIIAAGSVVISDIPANCLAAGNPATVKKNYDL